MYENNGLFKTDRKWVMAKRILIKNIRQEVTMSEVANIINVARTNPLFQRVIRYFEEQNIIIYTRQDINRKYFKIDNKKLQKDIEESDLFLEVGEYIKYSRYFYDNIPSPNKWDYVK